MVPDKDILALPQGVTLRPNLCSLRSRFNRSGMSRFRRPPASVSAPTSHGARMRLFRQGLIAGRFSPFRLKCPESRTRSLGRGLCARPSLIITSSLCTRSSGIAGFCRGTFSRLGSGSDRIHAAPHSQEGFSRALSCAPAGGSEGGEGGGFAAPPDGGSHQRAFLHQRAPSTGGASFTPGGRYGEGNRAG